MSLSSLLSLIDKMPAYRHLVKEVERGGKHRAAILDSAKPYLIASLHCHLRLPMLVITAQPERAVKLREQLLVWCGDETTVLLFPAPDVLPYERFSPDPLLVRERMWVLSVLSDEDSLAAPIITTSVPSMVRKTIPQDKFISMRQVLKTGMHIELSPLLAKWTEMGYELSSMVELPGMISRRGGILDIYPPDCELPARIEFFGNHVESIRTFDPTTQRSKEEVPSVTVTPVKDATMWEEGEDTILDYLPQNTVVILDEPDEIARIAEELDAHARQLRRRQVEKCELSDKLTRPYLTENELQAKLAEKDNRLILTRWGDEDNLKNHQIHSFAFSSAPTYTGQLSAFLSEVERLLKENQRLVLISHQAERLSELLNERGIFALPLPEVQHLPQPGSVTLVHGSLDGGWVAKNELTLLTDVELFGFTKQRRAGKRPAIRQALLPDLLPGDYVVHIEHGIAKFAGTTRRAIDGVRREYLVLEYAAGDRLYVPIEQIDRVNRYLGSGSRSVPTLGRLGTQEWARLKQRVREATREIAQEMLDLYAAREIIHGFPFSPDTEWQKELEVSFPYVETDDQIEVVKRVKEDMERVRPMDRLVCGDVGYGKTEVALRAAFKAVMGGKQVAVVVPTTILAEQHFTTFSQRLAAFPVNVEMLSRFRSNKEQDKIIAGLADGTVDICIGTHRLLQKDVVFKDLGLVIIDEEQRFGVVHKERFKQIRKEVDALTCSATPIPRTLHMSLVGVREMSTMETPPEERLPIKTYVGEYSEAVVREGVLRELERGGQVFFVHNRVQDIQNMAHTLQHLFPELKIGIAHGQMLEEELESIMLQFICGEIDMLVCTTIIESGLDIPNTNTLIVNDADKLGLAQLYQLRGRVGRGDNRAYAYFFYGKGKQLTTTAEKRLRTIFEATELGAGFRIAMKDLEIRGAGNLLGKEQSGHIAAVGFDLYCQLLADAVENLKKDAPPTPLHPPTPTLNIPLPAHIPEDYIPDISTRLSFYRRLAKIESPEEVQEIAEELDDRFGKPTTPTQNLLYMVGLKTLAMQAGIQSISAKEGRVIIKMREGIKPSNMTSASGIKVSSSQVQLDMKSLGKEWMKLLEDLLREMGGNITDSIPIRSDCESAGNRQQEERGCYDQGGRD